MADSFYVATLCEYSDSAVELYMGGAFYREVDAVHVLLEMLCGQFIRIKLDNCLEKEVEEFPSVHQIWADGYTVDEPSDLTPQDSEDEPCLLEGEAEECREDELLRALKTDVTTIGRLCTACDYFGADGYGDTWLWAVDRMSIQ